MVQTKEQHECQSKESKAVRLKVEEVWLDPPSSASNDGLFALQASTSCSTCHDREWFILIDSTRSLDCVEAKVKDNC